MSYVNRITRLVRAPLLVTSGFSAWQALPVAHAQVALSPSVDSVPSAKPDSSKTANYAGELSCEQRSDRLTIRLAQRPIAEYVFSHEKILRPYFTHLKTPSGIQVTRNHPPLADVDAVDHDTMHPGLWLAFGDINGIDFWRNHGSIRHLRYTQSPVVNSNQLTFATESELLSPDDETQGRLSQHFALTSSANNWLLVWQATFQADEQPLIFGDQEEMGCGARVATAITEKNGGSILNSSELSTAAATWGQPAQWCNYSGMFEQHHIGITLMAAPENFRTCWWHNRDYGLMVANPFGRAAMKQGGTSQVRVEIGQSLRLCFGACIHQGSEHNLQQTYRDFVRLEGFLPKD